MQQRDIIKDEIEQLGRALGKVLAGFLGLKNSGSIDSAIEITNERLESELQFDFERLAKLDLPELEEHLKSVHYTDQHLDKLANYYYEIGILKKTENDKEASAKYLSFSKRLLDLLDRTSSTITFERMGLREKVEVELKEKKY